MKNILFILGFLFSLNTVSAQIDRETSINPKAEQKLADLLYAQGHYYSAIQYYREVIQEKPEWRYPRYWLAMSYLKARDYKNAELWFKKFIKHPINPKGKIKKLERENRLIYNKAQFFYGQSLKHNKKYSEAITAFKAFKSTYVPGDKKHKDNDDLNWNKKANIEIKGAELGIKQSNKTKRIKIASLGDEINTAYEDASPVALNDTVLYYSSLNQDRLVYIEKIEDIPIYKIFESKKVNGVWGKGKPLPRNINDGDLSTGNITLSNDGNRMYYCKCIYNEIDEIICAIHYSEKENGKWSQGEILNSQINDPNFTSTQPSVRSSGDNWDIVYFTSDRDGGKGGMDIWYFMRTAKGDYRGPRHLRGPINTAFDEITPFYSAIDSSFYFSSNGHPTIGGFDIFVSTENDEMQWIKPINLGSPINSSADDLYYRKQTDKTNGFLVSNRDGTSLIHKRYRGDDLYSFRDFKYGLSGLVVKNDNDKSGKTIVENATIKLFTTNLEGNEVLVKEIAVSDGEYFFDLKPDNDYKIEVIKPGFSSTFEYVSTKNLLTEDTLTKDLSILKTQIIATGSLYSENDSTKKRKLDGALVTLIEIMNDGTEKELRALKISAREPSFYFNLDLNKKYAIKTTKDGYFSNVVDVDFSKLTKDQDTLYSHAMMSKIEIGKAYALDNILYEFGEANLTKASEKIITGLAKIMQENPLIIVELSAHTDAIGSDAANLKLSQARAQSCVDFLIIKGLSETRLIAKGYGESKAKVPNTNPDGSDNETNRAINRRTEFKIVGGL